MKNEEISKKLAEPFNASEIEWRLQGVDQGHMRGMAVPYIDSRAIQRRLDYVVGPFGWRNEFQHWRENSQLCCISILASDENGNHEWISKWDGAENSKIEPVKGGLSDSFKRAAVLWGIGRYLYEFSSKWVDIEKKGDSSVIKQTEYAPLDFYHDAEVQRLTRGQAGIRNIGGFSSKSEGQANRNSNSPPPRQNNSQAAKEKPVPTTQKSASKGNAPQYLIKRKLVSSNANGQSTQLEMVSLEDGTIVKAFVKGTNDSLTEGVKLKNIKITEKQGTHRNYNVLEAYDFAS